MRSMLRDDYVGYNESRDEWEWLSLESRSGDSPCK